MHPLVFALVAGIAALAALARPDAARADWACEMALCLSNPAGAMAVTECRPPIQRLYRLLARGGSFPMCRSVDGYVNFTQYGIEFQEECPAGTRTLHLATDGDRSGNAQGRRRGNRWCESFQPLAPDAQRRLSRPGSNADDRTFEWRAVDGERVYGEVRLTPAPPRAQPRFLEYVVDGDTRRLWW